MRRACVCVCMCMCAYCVAKMFRQDKFVVAFKAGLKMAINLNLHWIQSGTPYARNPDHMVRSRAILELAYFKRDLRNSRDENEHVRKERETLRRKQGERLLQLCPGDWRRRRIDFVDVVGLASRDEVVDCLYALLIGIGFHVLAEPSTNKWLSFWSLTNIQYAANIH